MITAFIAAVRQGSLHSAPNKLHRQVTLIWNEVGSGRGQHLACNLSRSRRSEVLPNDSIGPFCRIGSGRMWMITYRGLADLIRFIRMLGYGRWRREHFGCAGIKSTRPLPPWWNRVRIHAPFVRLADLVTPNNLKSILRHRLAMVDGRDNVFNHLLASALLQIAREWVKVDPAVLADLKRLVRKVPMPPLGLTTKNKRFLRQFDDPDALRRLVQLPDKLWAEVKRDSRPSFRTLAKAHVAIAIAILTYLPVQTAESRRI